MPEIFSTSLKSVFLPADGFGEDIINQFQGVNLIQEATEIKQRIELMWEDLGFYGMPDEAPSLTFKISTIGTESIAQFESDVTISLDWYTPYKPMVDNILSAFMVLFFLFRLYKNLPSIISGQASTAAELSVDISKKARE